jgi:hypothetical protein
MKIDLFVDAEREPNKIVKIKTDNNVIFHIYGGVTPNNGELKLGTFVELADFINHTNFYLFRMNSFWTSGGSKMRIYL